jgi:hypothetical protein
MIELKCIRPILDTTVNRKRTKGEEFKVTPERVKEMETSLGDKFKLYFEVIKIEKKVTPKISKKK